MAESISDNFKGDTSWVYVGQGKAEQRTIPEKPKPDTELHRFMQDVFDVAVPVAIRERDEVAAVNGELAAASAELLMSKSKTPWQRYKEHGDLKRFVIEQDEAWRGRSLPNRLGRLATYGTMMAGTFGLDRVSDLVASKFIFSPEKLRVPPFKPITLKNGNKEALGVGWEFVTDTLVGKGTDLLAQTATNRKSIGFVSPLSKAVSTLGTTLLNITGNMYNEKTKNIPIINSFVNPGFIESAFRFTSALPWVGIPFEYLYAEANKQLIKADGVMPFGIDLAYNMAVAKEKALKNLPNVSLNKPPAIKRSMHTY